MTTGAANASVFEGVYGNHRVLHSLAVALSSPSHAYLFHGPDGVGKHTVARRFGAALVSGGEAHARERALRGLHPDLAEIAPEGVFTTISQVREAVRLASSRPFEGSRRVIVLEADTFNVQAANALLKTLEEPEEATVFVLISSSSGSVLPTIASRAQSVRFDRVSTAEIESFLKQDGVSAEESGVYAALGRGSVGLALRYAKDQSLRSLRDSVFEAGLSLSADFEARHLAASGIVARAEAVGAQRESDTLEALEDPDRKAKDRAKRLGRAARDGAFRESVELLAMLYRDAAVIRAGAGDLVANVDRREEIRAAVERHPEADWAGAALSLEEARGGLTYNVSPEAMLEVALSRTRRQILGSYRGS